MSCRQPRSHIETTGMNVLVHSRWSFLCKLVGCKFTCLPFTPCVMLELICMPSAHRLVASKSCSRVWLRFEPNYRHWRSHSTSHFRPWAEILKQKRTASTGGSAEVNSYSSLFCASNVCLNLFRIFTYESRCRCHQWAMAVQLRALERSTL